MRLSIWLGIGIALLLVVFTLVYVNVSSDSSVAKIGNQTLQAGSYTVNMGFTPDPPQVSNTLTVTLTPHNGQQLSGRVKAVPGLGTDASTITAPLVSEKGSSGVLTGTLTLPVRGAWQIVAELNGPQGQGSAQINLIVAAPHAIPLWFGWLLGLSPLVGVIWFFWQQGRYRRLLLLMKYQHM